jgi:hypothetical protein
MTRDTLWTQLLALARLPHAASTRESSSHSDLNTQDQREYRRMRQASVGSVEAGCIELRGLVENIRW